ncbi:hypothetical protein [Sphingobacterium detergens]|uniref:Uncharacterized protein n=1 Tax=Sphingobacterium detergens TaxID=1145106 RepID=A0A420B6R1_SPHD1|nr:hypothetical protein [Sphingobacterium detergens]RKE52381.1 hypothetical protein DFQ12_2617 [Sphingobacterium detergens]
MYNIFYLDDEKEALVKSIIQKLETLGSLKITRFKPVAFETEIQHIESILKDYDAIFLDLKLDGEQEDGIKVYYQAPPLAQMIRTLATEEKVPNLPIILCSTEDRINQSYLKDFTSHDLFDWTFIKDEINDLTIQKIEAIITAYKSITESPKDFNKLLGRNYQDIDQRILSRFINEENPPIHEIARYIFKGIVKPGGILINEPTLAARLGIDISHSHDWSKLVDIFHSAKYSGIFSESWKRWWNDLVLDKFEELTNENLASLDSEERVILLKEVTKLTGLTEAQPLEFSSSSNFWNVCEITELPVDPFDSFKIDNRIEPLPWQDYKYVSMYGMVAFPHIAEKKGIKIYPEQLESFNSQRRKID